jgi:TfoX/Sxy family transcriptional regulator of competence genes
MAASKAAKTAKTATKKQARKKATPAEAAADADPRLLEIAKAYKSDKRVTMGKLFASVGLRVNDKIFAMVVRGNLVVKLPKARVDEFVERGVATRFETGPGRVMKEWAVFAGTKPAWASLAREAYEFVGSL